MLTVASVPSGHVYVRHLTPVDSEPTVRRLPDPDPDRPERPAQERWWPPAMLTPGWAARAEFDVFHVHFGFDACPPEQLAQLSRVLRERGKRFVLTVHDLRNPHHRDRAVHDAQLDVLVPAADRVVTLTPGAAEEIRGRWSRDCVVVPHPHVVEFDTMARLQQERRERVGRPFRVGLHVKSLRAAMAPMRILPALLEVVRSLPHAVLQVNGHRDVLEPGAPTRDPELADWLTRHAAAGEVDLRVHDFLPDDALWEYLASLDVSVLPYRFGTHSGWLEACRDVGTTVVAPSCGFYHQQGPVLGYAHDEGHFDPESLAHALVTAHDERPDFAAPVHQRRSQREQVAAAHHEIYAGRD